MKSTTLLIITCLLVSSQCSFAQNSSKQNKLYHQAVVPFYTPEYLSFRANIAKKFKDEKAGKFGMFVSGTVEDIATQQKIVAFTFDACIGHSDDYNADLINFLKKEKVPATLFVSGLWIDGNLPIFKELASDSLFELENHGLLHRLCSINGESKYGIAPTTNVNEVIDEMELNARKMATLTGKRPKLFRSATTYTDETSTKIASALGMNVVSYDILSGDAVAFTPASVIRDNILQQIHQGAIIIMHFNHPKWHEKEALEMVIPILRKEGYKFVTLENHPYLNKQK
jgi:peptidoglycan/xylan/chitin deacetylase (PgdA/CDA1 family)